MTAYRFALTGWLFFVVTLAAFLVFSILPSFIGEVMVWEGQPGRYTQT